MMFSTKLSAFAWLFAMSFLFGPIQSFKVNTDKLTFVPSTNQTRVIDCGGKADSKTPIKYKLGSVTIFDSQNPTEIAPFVEDLKDGTIALLVKGQTGGFEDLSCERDGKPSENLISIFAVVDITFQVKPEAFKINSSVEMDCSVKIRPHFKAAFSASIDFKAIDEKSSKVFLKNVYQQEKDEYSGTYLENDVKDIMMVEPGEGKTHVQATVTPLSDKARGTYSCMVEVEGVIYGANSWYTGELIQTTTVSPGTNSPKKQPAEETTQQPTAPKKPGNSGAFLQANIYLYIFVYALISIVFNISFH